MFYLVHRKFGLKFLGILLVVLGSTGVAIKAGASPDGARTIGEKLILSTFLPYMIFFELGILAS